MTETVEIFVPASRHSIAHFSDSVEITDANMTFGEFKNTPKYIAGLESVLRQIKGDQHLRFIGDIYKTPEVCIIAVKNSPRFDVYSVPEKIRDYVLQEVVKSFLIKDRWTGLPAVSYRHRTWWYDLSDEFKTDTLTKLYNDVIKTKTED